MHFYVCVIILQDTLLRVSYAETVVLPYSRHVAVDYCSLTGEFLTSLVCYCYTLHPCLYSCECFEKLVVPETKGEFPRISLFINFTSLAQF